jgi:hypothetical protein
MDCLLFGELLCHSSLLFFFTKCKGSEPSDYVFLTRKTADLDDTLYSIVKTQGSHIILGKILKIKCL